MTMISLGDTGKNLIMTCYLLVSFLTPFCSIGPGFASLTKTAASFLVSPAQTITQLSSKGSISLRLLLDELKLYSSQTELLLHQSCFKCFC